MPLTRNTSAPDAPVVGAQAGLESLWAQHEEAILLRVGVLERAVAVLSRGPLDDKLRSEAEREAHKLAGALGTFGFTKGSERAREAELILEVPEALGPARVPLLSELVADLREELGAKPVDRSTVAPARRWEDAPLILVIDDDLELAGRLAAEATRRGIRAQIASTPAEGRKLAALERPDVGPLGPDLRGRHEQGIRPALGAFRSGAPGAGPRLHREERVH